MKRYFIYIIMAVAALFTGCTPEVVDETPEMKEVGDIAVTFSVDGEEVRSLDLSSVSHNIKVDVTLNNEGIYWNAVSNKDWCYIDNEVKHRGSGSFTMVINANDSFEARETATIKFIAGEYEEKMLTVDHNGNVFVLDQVYAAATKAAGSFTTKVKTFDAAEAWHFECDPWITATKGNVTTAEGETFTEVTIAWEANADASRYGEVKLVKDGKDYADGFINIWQFGTELNYDEEGNVLLAAQEPAPLEIRVPTQTVKEITMPSWVEYTIQDNGDKTVSYMLQFAGNPSDANHIRTTELSLSFLSGAADIQLPVIKQEFYAMEGLLTGPGLALFAKTWNEGGDVSQWFVDGVPTIIDNIDLTEVKEWTPIGTEERPWTGEFNGNGKKLINFTASQPLFGVCKDATIKGISFDKTSTFEVKGTYTGEKILATLAASIVNTTIENCSNSATISMDATSTDSKTYVAGLVGKADKDSYIVSCTNGGTINVASSSSADADSEFYVGGIVAHNTGKVDQAFANGSVSSGAVAGVSYVGGIVGYNANEATVTASHNAGAVNYSAGRGSSVSLNGYVGGVTALAQGTVTYNTNEGTITSTSAVENIHIGGVVGAWLTTDVVFNHNTVGNTSHVVAEGAALHTFAGGLAGLVSEDVASVEIDLTKYAGTLEGKVTAGVCQAVASATISAGGIFGKVMTNTTISNIAWTGTTMFYQKDAITAMYANFGGLVGWTTYPITISNIESEGEVLAEYAKSAAINFGSATDGGGGSIGGLLGRAEEGATISNCTMNKPTSWNIVNSSNQYTSTGSSKHFDIHMGGVAGRIVEGDSSITNCHNKGRVYNLHYNNQPWTTTYNTNCTGGILGSFGSKNNPMGSITIENCTNAANVNTHRGTVAGIAGLVTNGTIKGCEYKIGGIVETYLGNSVCAGIVGIAFDSNISDCVATVNLVGIYAGSVDARMGGIVAHLMGASSVSGCSYYGIITPRGLRAMGTPEYFGGIVGWAQGDEISISDCRCGGTINDNVISENNLSTYIANYSPNGGTAYAGTATGNSYWNGK